MKFDLLNFLKKGGPKTTITSINITLQNYVHSINGMQVRESTFEVAIPYTNKTHTDLLTNSTEFKAEEAKPFVIKAITVADPFKLLSYEPKTPIEVKADQRIEFKLKVEAPKHNYTGPMNVTFNSDNVETIHVEISKTALIHNGTKTEIETSSRILNIPKGQIFVEKVQLYKALSYNDAVNAITIEAPFKFVSSMPKLPLKIDDTNSYILELYIQAPQTSYAGPLEITLL